MTTTIDEDIQKIFDEMNAKEEEFPRSIGGPASLIPLRKLKKLKVPYWISHEWTNRGKLHRTVNFKNEEDMEVALKFLRKKK